MPEGMLRLRSRVTRLFEVHPAYIIAAVVVIGVFILGDKVQAEIDVSKYVLSLVGIILGEIIAFMGKLVILLANILIQFASYNNFVHAQPVEIGWKLMRDVANMFFIVVLLVSAFSTIIGYKEFHYSAVLPKLLLMAVLINFSKTLIGLMIDFSQILMLTFVNAFKQAAGGNFVTALKLSGVTTLAQEAESNSYQLEAELIPAAILGVVMLGVSMTLLVIMIAFIVFRIVGLWLLLIMSPMAFFAWALPGKMKKALGAFTNDFWERLSNLLIAGPVMAFFLWLALAVVQGSAEPFSDMYNQSAVNVANFATKAGNGGQIASFIVAVALMLAGVEFAIKSAGAISSTLGKFASTVSKGGGVAVHLARGASRVTSKVARTGFEGVDRLADVRGKVGRVGLAVSGMAGGAGAATFAGMAAHRGKMIGEKQKALKEMTASLDPATRAMFLRDRASAQVFTREAAAAKMALADDATTGVGMKSRTEIFKKQLAKRTDLDDAQKQALAESMATEQAGKDVKAGQGVATELGDDAKITSYGDALKKNSSLHTEWKDQAAIKNTAAVDWKKHLADTSVSAFKDSRSALAHMSALGLINENTGALIETDENEELRGKFFKGERGTMVNEMLGQMSADDRVAHFKAMDGDKEAIKKADAARLFVARDSESGKIGFVNPATAGPQVKVEQRFEVRNEAAINQGKERLREMGRAGFAANSAEAIAVKGDMAGSGATLAEAFKFNAGQGVFENNENREAFEATIAALSAAVATGDEAAMSKFSRLDTASLAANPDAYNEARSAAIAHFNLEELKKGFEAAGKSGNSETQRKIQELLNIISKEGVRAQKMMKPAQLTFAEIQTVAKSPASAEAAPIIQRMVDAGVGEETQAVEAARAFNVNNQVTYDPQARAIRGKVIDKVDKAMMSYGQATGKAATVVAREAGTGRKMARLAEAAKTGAQTLKERRQKTMETKLLAAAEKKEQEEARRAANAPPADEGV